MVEILHKHNIQFSSFDIFSDEEVRQGLKTYSNWPTYPQLYVSGELIGGLDIVKVRFFVKTFCLKHTFLTCCNKLKPYIIAPKVLHSISDSHLSVFHIGGG